MGRGDRELLAGGFLTQLHRFTVAAWLYYSGKLELLRRERLAKSNHRWRILRYQHVVNPETLPLPADKTGYVRPKTFDAHLNYLANNANVIPLTTLISLLESGKEIPDKTVILTFDLGYKTFKEHAFPTLQRYGLPATLFVPTAFIGTKDLFWSDKILLAMLIMQSHRLPFPKLSLLGEDFHKSVQKLSPDEQITNTTISLLIEAVSRLTATERLAVLSFFGDCLTALGGQPEIDFFLTWDDLRMFAEMGVELGSLGHRHAVYSDLRLEQIEEDLRESFRKFEAERIVSAKVLAFPEGVVAKEARTAMEQVGLKYSVAIGDYVVSLNRTQSTVVLGRLDMYQAAAFTKELFACRLWGAEYNEIRF